MSDDVGYSKADIVTEVRTLSDLPRRIFYFPPSLLKKLLSLIGNLRGYISVPTDVLGSTPKYTLE